MSRLEALLVTLWSRKEHQERRAIGASFIVLPGIWFFRVFRDGVGAKRDRWPLGFAQTLLGVFPPWPPALRDSNPCFSHDHVFASRITCFATLGPLKTGRDSNTQLESRCQGPHLGIIAAQQALDYEQPQACGA